MKYLIYILLILFPLFGFSQQKLVIKSGGNTTTTVEGNSVTYSFTAILVDAAVSTQITEYGFCPAYTNTSIEVYAANTTTASNLTDYYITEVNSNEVTVIGSGIIEITSPNFSYAIGSSYFLQDDGTLATIGDMDGDSVDYDSKVVTVIATNGGNIILNLHSPRHDPFIN